MESVTYSDLSDMAGERERQVDDVTAFLSCTSVFFPGTTLCTLYIQYASKLLNYAKHNIEIKTMLYYLLQKKGFA